ncbi:thioredoxin domain-containing protein, partial [Candidatus Woesearchaeota archaeon]|nr:thioredoxin domain-containing protein [Candidatus Woesearchaeota archaeon]
MRKITPSLILILLCIFYAFPALADSTCSDNNDNGYCIQIITPTEANQKYDVGDSLEITWLQQKIDKVTIGYKTCPSCLDWISYNLAVNPSDTTGSFTWKIPERLNGKKDLQIYLIGYNTGVGSETSTSNNFSITEASDSTDDTLETTPSQEEQTSAPDQIPNPETPSEETTTSPTEEAPTTTEPVTTLPPNSLNDHFKGDLNAPVTIIEYGDYECPFCKQFHQQTLPLIEKEYIQTGKVKLIFKHFPLAEIHKNAQKASEAAECASNQGKFWEYHNLLFENTNNLDEDSLNNFADKTNLNLQEFSDCLKGGKERTSV